MSKSANSFLFYFGLFMSLVYLILGISFIISPSFLSFLVPPEYSIIAGVLLILYGLLRVYRVYHSNKQS